MRPDWRDEQSLWGHGTESAAPAGSRRSPIEHRETAKLRNPDTQNLLLRLARRLVSLPRAIARRCLTPLPAFTFIEETRNTQTPISFDTWWQQQVLGINRGPYWPVHPSSTVAGWRNILAGIETSPGATGGCYIQALGKIFVGDYTQIAPNVGLISSNHVVTDNRKHVLGTIRIGAYGWIGFGAVVLPGVELGDFTIVGANAVVTKSFPEGYCVIGGNPAKLIRRLDPAKCVRHVSPHEYHGYIPKAKFEEFRKRNLLV
jgi:acetyltransferase-like isoleucine patch superfamily enzyme